MRTLDLESFIVFYEKKKIGSIEKWWLDLFSL